MDIFEFRKMNLEEATNAYKQLRTATKVIFSGDVDPMINQLDYVKVQAKLKNGKMVSEQEQRLIEELGEIKKAHDLKQVVTGIWDSSYHQGSIPHSREGATGCLI